MAKLKRLMHPGGSGITPTTGKDVEILKFGLHRYEDNFFKGPPWNNVYGPSTEQAVQTLQELEMNHGNDAIHSATGVVGQPTWDVVWNYLDAYRRLQYRLFIPPKPKPLLPDLGPVWSGGISILYHSLTHETDGLPGYPAFDDGWRAGRVVIAPEDLTVTEQSGAQGGDAFYATGKSKLKYWFAHVVYAPPTGRAFKKGEGMASIANILPSQGGPHVHTGIDGRAVIGHEFSHHTDYTSGAPTVGEQLAAALL